MEVVSQKVLVCCDVRGRWRQLYEKIDEIQLKKGKFDMLLSIGAFFPIDDNSETFQEIQDYLQGKRFASIPTYFLGYPDKGTELIKNIGDKGEICRNIYYLGKGGRKTIHSLDIVYVSGIYCGSAKELTRTSQYSTSYSTTTCQNVCSLRSENEKCDIILSNEIPSWFDNQLQPSAIPSPLMQIAPSDGSRLLCSSFSPRYVLSRGKDIFYERAPFETPSGHACRLIVMPAFGTTEKRDFYAAAIKPIIAMDSEALRTKPAGTTLSPFDPKLNAHWRQAARRRRENEREGKKSNDANADADDDDFINELQRDGELAFGTNTRTPMNQMDGSAMKDNGGLLPTPVEDSMKLAFLSAADEAQLRRGAYNRGGGGRGRGGRGRGDGRWNARDAQEMRRDDRNRGCWFCLGNEAVEAHLIVWIGQNIYIAIPKGPLCAGHALLIPVEHVVEPLPTETRGEATVFEKCVAEWYRNGMRPKQEEEKKEEKEEKEEKKEEEHKEEEKEKEAKPLQTEETEPTNPADVYVPVVIEKKLNLKAAQHATIEVIPIKESVQEAVVNEVLRRGRMDRIKFEDVDPEKPIEKLCGDQSFFSIKVGNKRLLYRLEADERFPIQLGRESVATVLGCPDRSDWRRCVSSKEDETAQTAQFAASFNTFIPQEFMAQE